MRVAFYLIYVALFVSVRCEDNTNFVSRLLEPVNVAADPETINYILPKLTTKYRPSSDWRGVTDPRFYVLTEMDSNDINNPEEDNNIVDTVYLRRKKQARVGESGGSLSIVNSLDVLRNRLLLEIARKKAKEGANRNRQLLMNLGKRSFQHIPSIFLHNV
ncbi:diuretic hormone 44 isoform X1 [Cylas formicarius]|uniref:diuretic hormone 44 isoform X1 n=1 Tax=Cylas formicarius TaxID=197179 RepID=UPI0029585900|nr:diuretic hormone 44 isoform X1 [Cylas formicarius]XP_060518869.1 diuretic hormone 44 isoform X1 [Cylas formicarius]